MTTLTAEQRRAIQPDHSVWVGASAGSGKTHVLSNRVLRLLLDGAAPTRVLCLTFTKAAAAQMANRIHKRLAGWAVASEAALVAEVTDLLGQTPAAADILRARQLFADVLDAPGGLKIQTIHSFCQMVLARFPLEAGVRPGASAMDERKQAEVLEDVKHTLMAQVRAGVTTPDVAQAFAHISDTLGEDQFRKTVAALISTRERVEATCERAGGVATAVQDLAGLLGVNPGDTEEAVKAKGCADLGHAPMWAALGALSAGSTKDVGRADQMRDFLEADPGQRPACFEDYSKAFLTGTTGAIQKNLGYKQAIEALPNLLDLMQAEAERILDIRQRMTAVRTFELSRAILIYGSALLQAYAQAKRRLAVLDYNDLISAVHDLLTRTPSVAPWVLYKLDGGLDHLLVDEAQDTSPQQWAIVAALVDEFYRGLGQRGGTVRTVFVVGDIKQSIFSFQGADSHMFAKMQQRFARHHGEAGRPMDHVPLARSFRSAPAILAMVDAVFASGCPAAFGVAQPDIPVLHEAFKQDLPGRVELWPLATAPKEEVASHPWQPPVQQVQTQSAQTILATAIARHIQTLIATGQRRPGDIMILVRRRNAFFESVIWALKAEHVPVAGQDRLKLDQQIAVQDLLSLARFLLLPSDDLSLAEVLKSPLLGLTEEQVFELAYDRKPQALWQVVLAPSTEAWRQPVRDFLALQLARADLMTPFELFMQVLTTDGGRARFIARLGAQVEDVLDEFLSLALHYELENAPSLQGFVHWFEAQDTDVKLDLEQARDEVRVMTVHGAKGLEAPVVYLADTTSVPSLQKTMLVWLGQEPAVPVWRGSQADQPQAVKEAQDQYQAAQMAEYNRLLYVALTRAEQHLIICGAAPKNKQSDECWYEAVTAAVRTMPTTPLETELGPGVVYQDGSWSEAGMSPMPHGTEPLPLPAWIGRPAPEEPTPSAPLTPSRPDYDEPAAQSPVAQGQAEAVTDPYVRGRLIHTLLELLPSVPAQDQQRSAEQYLLGVAADMTEAQRAEMIETTLETLHHADFAAVFGPNSRAEVPLAGLIDRQGQVRVLSGQIDRLVVTPEEILVVDFKTNRPAPRTSADVPAVYLRQMALYRAAINTVYTDRPVRCALLWTDGPFLMPLDAALLDAHFKA